jgi:hypothetical protein
VPVVQEGEAMMRWLPLFLIWGDWLAVLVILLIIEVFA